MPVAVPIWRIKLFYFSCIFSNCLWHVSIKVIFCTRNKNVEYYKLQKLLLFCFQVSRELYGGRPTLHGRALFLLYERENKICVYREKLCVHKKLFHRKYKGEIKHISVHLQTFTKRFNILN